MKKQLFVLVSLIVAVAILTGCAGPLPPLHRCLELQPRSR